MEPSRPAMESPEASRNVTLRWLHLKVHAGINRTKFIDE